MVNLTATSVIVILLGMLAVGLGALGAVLGFRANRTTNELLLATLEQNRETQNNIRRLYEEIFFRHDFEHPERSAYFTERLNQLSDATQSIRNIGTEIMAFWANRPKANWDGSCSEKDKIDMILSLVKKHEG